MNAIPIPSYPYAQVSTRGLINARRTELRSVGHAGHEFASDADAIKQAFDTSLKVGAIEDCVVIMVGGYDSRCSS